MKTLRIILLIFLLGLIAPFPTLVHAADSDDIIKKLENAQSDLTEYVKKIKLKQEVGFLKTEIQNLETNNKVLTAKCKYLEEENKVISNKVDKLKQAKDDHILTAVVILFFFSLAGFVCSLLLLSVVWRKKIKGYG